MVVLQRYNNGNNDEADMEHQQLQTLRHIFYEDNASVDKDILSDVKDLIGDADWVNVLSMAKVLQSQNFRLRGSLIQLYNAEDEEGQ